MYFELACSSNSGDAVIQNEARIQYNAQIPDNYLKITNWCQLECVSSIWSSYLMEDERGILSEYSLQCLHTISLPSLVVR